MSRHTFDNDTLDYNRHRDHRLSGHSSITNSQIMDRPLSRPPSELSAYRCIDLSRAQIRLIGPISHIHDIPKIISRDHQHKDIKWASSVNQPRRGEAPLGHAWLNSVEALSSRIV
ncbi:hypothetical protein RRG08_021702 [Elysia crispata]|uniref:Uncharacterized protein n=1 Tax=Elysia crispata TaxID=231223 RepID=A0AAE1DP02_9GAST|nr:hypothetical protein RRG08_021702 [Elysia crispata]